MKCLLCDSIFLSEDVLINHYMYYHSINENDVYLNDLFKPDTIYRGCDFCHVEFENTKSKRTICFSSTMDKWEVKEEMANYQ